MDNQHRKISGYRELSQEEVDLMNRIKAKGSELLELHAELVAHIKIQRQACVVEEMFVDVIDPDELARLDAAEPHRWAAMGKTDIQTGIMALVRAVAQPEGI
ncbi:hypothetical protein D3C87_930350 [compost metagenome]